MSRRFILRVLPFVAALIPIVIIVFLYRSVLRVNQTTVALTLLLAILLISTIWGLAVAIVSSVVAMLAFNFFFLPPVGTFTIADPQNWVALAAFLATSLIASQLSTRVRREAEESKRRRREAVTHDFRTPLTSIKASVTSLLSSHDAMKAEQHELLTVIDEECDRLNQLVGDAAEMARLDAGEFELDLQATSINAIVSAALEYLKTALGSRPVRVNLSDDLPLVRADAGRARDVLVRLIENANAYTPADRPITISAEVKAPS